MGKKSQRIQAERRLANVDLLAMAEMEIENLPRRQGDAIGCLQWTDFRTGKVRRWTIRIGNRRDQIKIESPGTIASQSHGWTWFLTQLRKHLS